MSITAHQPRDLPEDHSDEELSDEQIQQLLDEAERSARMRQNAASSAATANGSAPLKLPKLNPGHIADVSLSTSGSITRLDPSKLINKEQRAMAEGIKKIDDPIVSKKEKLAAKGINAGSQWFNMPKTDLTPELRRDLQLLKMRSVLDPKRFFKKDSRKPDVPEFSQVGTVIEGPTEFFNGRINNKDRKKTFVDEVLAQEAKTGRFKNKYQEISRTKTSGKKAYYQALKAKRKGRVEKR